MPAWGTSLTHLKVPAWVHSEWMELAQRRAILATQVNKWHKATKQEKGEILDTVCQVTGWHRDHARKMIRQRVAGVFPGPHKTREPQVTYDCTPTAPGRFLPRRPLRGVIPASCSTERTPDAYFGSRSPIFCIWCALSRVMDWETGRTTQP